MALILARKVDEGVVLQDERGRQIARVFVQKVDGYQVKLGFEAGPEVEILRDELLNGTHQARNSERG